jgi:integrase
MGRRVGSRNAGYFYRSGRGWYAQVAEPVLDDSGRPQMDAKGKPLVKRRPVALRDDTGEPLRSKSTPVAELKAALRRISDAPVQPVNSVTVSEVCDAYLAKVLDDGATATYKARGDTLFDFCYGLPPRFRNSTEQPTRQDQIHKGYGDLAASQLIKLHIDEWLRAHKNWKGGRRTRVQAVLRAMNYGVECGLLEENPIKGYKIPKATARVTYLTPEQEAALCKAANPELALAIKVCIRTGARPGCEFAKLTAKHVKDHGDRMEWIFSPHESKTKKLRTIRITDPEIIDVVRMQMKRFTDSLLFRAAMGEPWTRENLTAKFRYVKEKLLIQGMAFDDDACMYSCRHTYAKRTLQGYWTGKQTNIETLARLMGNSPKVCSDHYLQWTETYNEPLWESA